MKNWILTLLAAIMFALHQDFWNWRSSLPLVFGFIPIGLFYHVVYTLAAVVLMTLLVLLVWPRQLEEVGDREPRNNSSR